MRKTVQILLILLSGSFFSCEKIIEVNFDAASARYVIEGNISNDSTMPAEVAISQTRQFEDDNTFIGISGATVLIKVDGGATFNLPETSKGVYKTNKVPRQPGSTYELTVSLNGNIYAASSTMPAQLVSLDTLTVEDLSLGGNSKTIAPSYLDPMGLGNSYRFIQYANGVQVKHVFVQNDEISDGLRITRPLINQDGDLESGNVIKVDMLCIDRNVYQYWYSLDQAATGANQSATPANPVTNLTGDVLGYFSAHAISTKTITIP